MHTSLCHLTICLLLATGTVWCKQPHILLIIADDYGWNDIGYHGSEIETPTLDALAEKGVKLENYYVQPACTPTRSQLMSGRYQIHTGLQHKVIRPTVPNALPKEIPTLADKLKQVGYSTHIVGKWHLGFYKPEFLPTNRGFDSFYGYLVGAEDYFNHTRCHRGYFGLDFRDNLQPVLDKNGSYSAHVFAEQVTRVVENHAQIRSDEPLFMYVPFQSVHIPLQVPEKYLHKYSHIKNKARRTYAAMVSVMDEAVQNITATFQAQGLWEDTLLIFSTDNGGQVHVGGNNYPLRGWKGSMWEGGVRGVGFVHGNMIHTPRRTTHQLMHVSDWFPTLLSLAGGNTTGIQLDGHDVWQAISEDAPSPRTELLHNIDPLVHPRGKRLNPNLFDTRVAAAIRVGEWKLLTGDPGVDMEQHVKPPSIDIPLTHCNVQKEKEVNATNPTECAEAWAGITSHKDKTTPQSPLWDREIILQHGIVKLRESKDKNVWLYNIQNDPNEYEDLSVKYPQIVNKLLERLDYYNSTAVPCRFPPPDHNADPSKHGGVWGPWMDD